MLDKKEIQIRLKQAREALPGDVNARQFAMKAKNVDDSQYSKFERGTGTLGNKKIMELCSAWGINPDFLISGKGSIFVGEAKTVSADNYPPAKEEPTAMQILDRLSQAYLAHVETVKIQAEIMQEMKRTMALEATQADIKASLENLWNGHQWIASRQDVDRETQLRSLARLEGKDEDSLLKASNRRLAEIARESARLRKPDEKDKSGIEKEA